MTQTNNRKPLHEVSHVLYLSSYPCECHGMGCPDCQGVGYHAWEVYRDASRSRFRVDMDDYPREIPRIDRPWILNLTQHRSTKEQQHAGVRDPSPIDAERIYKLLTFDDVGSTGAQFARAMEVAQIARQYDPPFVMIGGAPFFMSTLTKVLQSAGLHPVFAFSKRESVEETLPDGVVVKRALFRHEGFVAG